MSNLVAGYVTANRAENLKQPESHLLLIMAGYSNDNGCGIWPSYNTLALSMKCERRTVITYMNSVISKNYIFKKGRAANGKSLTNQYYINVNKLKAEACQKPQRFDDEMNPFETEGVVINDHPCSDPRSPEGCSTITPVVIHDHPNHHLTFIEPPPNPVPNPTKEQGMLLLNVLRMGEDKKLGGKVPKDMVKQEEEVETPREVPISEIDKDLDKAMEAQGISAINRRAFLEEYPNRLHIRQKLNEMITYGKKKKIDSPNNFMSFLLKKPYEEDVPIAPKGNIMLDTGQQAIQESKNRDAIKDSPVAKEANSACMEKLARMGLVRKRTPKQETA